jgi:uncharacterized membrane protein YhaH (DUF805 family)
MNIYFGTFSKALDFKGRASIADYWVFAIINLIIQQGLFLFSPTVASIFSLIILLPTLSAAVRRMHDVNKSGLYILIPIYNFILSLTPGHPGPNKYGDGLFRSVTNSSKSVTNNSNNVVNKSKTTLAFPFTKINAYIILGGLVVVLFGYILMSGGGSADPNTFNAEELFSARRITVAPMVVLLGYIAIGVGIMYRGKKNQSSEIEKH